MVMTVDAGSALTILVLVINFITVVRVATNVERRFTTLETTIQFFKDDLAKMGVINRRTPEE